MKLLAALVGLLAATVVQTAAAQAKPLHIIVGAPPGGANDTVARIVAANLNLGQTVVVDNKPGAASMIAADYVARAPADGSVLLLVSQSVLSVSPRLQRTTTFDPKKAFAPVALIGRAPLVLVGGPALKANSVQSLVELAKAQPGAIDFGNGGIGTSPHMAGIVFGLATGTKLNSIPYPGEQAAITDVIGGRVPMMFANAPTAMMHIKSGKVRGIAVTSPERVPLAPELPTIAESGVPGFDAGTWLGFVAPAGTPVAVIQRLNAEVRRALTLPSVKQQLQDQGFSLSDMTPAQFEGFIAAEDERWAKVIRDGNIKAE